MCLQILAACSSSEEFALRYAGNTPGFVAGDGSVVQYPSSNRSRVQVSARAYTGEELDSAKLAGSVFVVNFWYAACPPCRAEAKDLQQVYTEFAPKGVRFFGVNIYDSQEVADSFAREFGVTYPSVLDAAKASVRLAFLSVLPPRAIPTTIIVDSRGGVAAGIFGAVNPSVLRNLIKDELGR